MVSPEFPQNSQNSPRIPEFRAQFTESSWYHEQLETKITSMHAAKVESDPKGKGDVLGDFDAGKGGQKVWNIVVAGQE
jgi:hypothetical protein